MYPLTGRIFNLQRVGLVRAGLPTQLEKMPGNRVLSAAIVIVRNDAQLAKVPTTGYYPRAIVASGARTRQQLLDNGIAKSWAFVEKGTEEIHADNEIRAHDLMRSLDQLLLTRFFGPARRPVLAAAAESWPHITQVFPFENAFTFTFKDQHFRQQYAIDPIQPRIGLVGAPVPVQAGQTIQAGDAKVSMPRSETGHHYNYAHVVGQLQTISMGGKNSELCTQIVRNWNNINEAANSYVEYMRSGNGKTGQMRPAFYPVDIVNGKVRSALSARGINYYDFAVWSAKALEDAYTAACAKGKPESLRSTAKGFFAGFKAGDSKWAYRVSPGPGAGGMV